MRRAYRTCLRRQEPPVILGLLESFNGRLGSGCRQSRLDAADRSRLRWGGIRSGHRLRLHVEWRRYADDRSAVGRQVGRPREHLDRAWRTHDRRRREDTQRLLANGNDRAITRRRSPDILARHLQGSGGRTMTRRLPALILFAAAAPLCASWARAQEVPAGPPLQLVRPEGAAGPPIVITLADALQRAKQNDAQFQASVADAEVAREDRVQAKAGLLPALSYT